MARSRNRWSRLASAGRRSIAPFVGDDALLLHLWRLLGEPGVVAELHFAAIHAAPHPTRDALARLTHAEISERLMRYRQLQ